MTVNVAQNLVIVGSSTGGVETLKEIFSGFPINNTSIVIVQHMPKFVNKFVVKMLNDLSEHDAKIVENNEMILNKKIYVAPSEFHTLIYPDLKFKLQKSESVNFVRPSIDVTMKSINANRSLNIVGVILTGMGKDGAQGIKHLKSLGAKIIVENPITAILNGMPSRAIETGIVDFILPKEQIAQKIISCLR